MKRPLVIRPLPQGEKLYQALRAQGYTPYLTPLLEIELLPLPENFGMQVAQADFIVITSQHCVATAASLLQKTSAQIFAIGPATAKKLQEYQLSSIYPLKDPSTETLFPLIKQHTFEISGKIGLLLQGKDPRPYLEQSLAKAGVMIRKIYLYERSSVSIDAVYCCTQWVTHAIDSVIITSGDLLVQFVKTLDVAGAHALLLKCTAYVVSSRLMEQAQHAGFKDVILTKGASDEAILHSLGTRS